MCSERLAERESFASGFLEHGMTIVLGFDHGL